VLNIEEILALPIRALERATKRIRWRLDDGKEFFIVGGRDKRPLPSGVACFTPAEVIKIVESDMTLEDFKKIVLVKEKFGGGVVDVLTPSEEGARAE
jgi:hypothetical protein